MGKKINLLVSDIDGTLIDPTETITSDFETLRNLLNQKEIALILASGRSLYETKKFIAALPEIKGVVINNGGGARIEEKHLWDELFPANALKDAIQEADKMGMTIIMSDGDNALAYKMTSYINNEIKTFGRFNHFYIPLKSEWDTLTFERVSIIDTERPGRVNTLLPLLKKHEQIINVCQHNNRHLEIVKKGVNKWEGVKKIAEYFGIRSENILAIGDGANDVELLSNAGIGIAVANAAEVAKQAAKAVTQEERIKGIIEAVECYC